MEAQKVTIDSEWARREELLNCPKFMEMIANMAKEMGIPAKEWNENRAQYAIFFANEFCAMENKAMKTE